MRQELEFQADRIEAVLALHKVPARVTGGVVTPRWVRFQVLPRGAKISDISNLDVELAAALNAPNVRISRHGAAVAIEVPRDDPQPVRLLPLYNQLTDHPTDQPPIPPATAILGLAEDGAPLLIRLPSPDVGHILIAGDEGAGKTMLLQSIVLSLAMTNSPDDLAFIFLGDGLAETALAIHQAGFPVLRVTSLGSVRAASKRVVFVADDVTAGNGSTPVPALEKLMAADMHHYILAWGGAPPKGIADLFKVQLIGQASGWNGTGAERLMGRGDFVAVFGKQRMRFQAAHISPEEIRETMSNLGRGFVPAGEVLSGVTQSVALPWPVNRLAESLGA